MITNNFPKKSRMDMKIQSLTRKVERLESGIEIFRIKKEKERETKYLERKLQRAREETARAHDETRSVRKAWSDVVDGCIEENDIIGKQNFDLMMENAALKEENLRLKKELYAAKTETEEEKGKVQELTRRINSDYTNSSTPSSQSPNHGKIHNSREKTGRKPGGQPGHEHHPRKPQKPTDYIKIPAPEEYLDKENFLPTNRTITKQLIKAHIVTEVIEYSTPEFRNTKTGQRVHAPFPEGIQDDVNYDGSVKALAYLLNNCCNISIGNTKSFIREASRGCIDLSTGMICKLSREFSQKTEPERNKIFLRLAAAPIMHADFTFGRVGGKNGTVIITATPEGQVLYQAREAKGDAGVEGSPLEVYNGTVVSDHEAAIIKHGCKHQECLEHIKRYNKEGIENEPEHKWHVQLAEWISKSIKYWDDVDNGEVEYTTEKAESYISQYRKIMEKAKEEYEYEPPNDCYKKGYNLYHRMSEDIESYVLFLREPSVPPTNNMAERCARKYKRKNAQVMTFRSYSGSVFFCDGLTVLESLKSANKNLFENVTDMFNRPTPIKNVERLEEKNTEQ